MNASFKIVLLKNFEGSIEMLKSIVQLCSDDLWRQDQRFYYLTYHTVIFLDYYLTYPVKDFQPLLPYRLVDADNLPEGAIDDVIPVKLYTRQEVITALTYIQQKCRTLLLETTEEGLKNKWIEESEIDMHGLCPSLVVNYSITEILFYNLRHLQHHVGQLNYMLRQKIDKAADWVAYVN